MRAKNTIRLTSADRYRVPTDKGWIADCRMIVNEEWLGLDPEFIYYITPWGTYLARPGYGTAKEYRKWEEVIQEYSIKKEVE